MNHEPRRAAPPALGASAARRRSRLRLPPAAAALLCLLLAACGGESAPGGSAAARSGGSDETLTVGAIPDQDPQALQRQFGAVSNYLSEELGVDVEYQPVTDYTASVTAFRRGDLDLVFFGGLTGVQARLQVPGAEAIAQRDIDASFRSVFIASTDSGIDPIEDVEGLDAVAGHTFTFGSEVSTSGRLMPQSFLSRAAVELGDFEGEPGFSGSHDKTAKLVESGTYEAGVLNESVWDERVEAGAVDTDEVREIFRTPPYHDYHWVAGPDLDERFGAGFTEEARDALLSLDSGDPEERAILDLFEAGAFIRTEPGNYERIETVGREAGLISE